ncbi:hypothetical protein Cme02nite_07300 [Catellatospora methionotrophica]|uniref:Uncharacterized protein n=1 Tax=Catellatospora methionotrophica TaxID=121620 RepID=A0A8J3L107_9ACTN|nr:hypothetical protein [Catellatospora methionotrophica]GIG12398.1 hypothetical protein Cme02nite_07300 [Catellatospora methionotrophica]
MGYTGRIVVGRSELAALRSKTLREYGVRVLWQCAYQDGWWQVQLDGDGDRPVAMLRALAAETGRPVLSAYVLDSDFAEVVGMTPGGTRWRAYLNERSAAEYGAPPLPYAHDELLAQVLTWAAEAGLAAAAVGEALVAQHIFAEEAFGALLTALGLVQVEATPRDAP